MKAQAIYRLMIMAYQWILRDILIEKIEDKDSDWDDVALNVCDSIFNYKE